MCIGGVCRGVSGSGYGAISALDFATGCRAGSGCEAVGDGSGHSSPAKTETRVGPKIWARRIPRASPSGETASRLTVASDLILSKRNDHISTASPCRLWSGATQVPAPSKETGENSMSMTAPTTDPSLPDLAMTPQSNPNDLPLARVGGEADVLR